MRSRPVPARPRTDPRAPGILTTEPGSPTTPEMEVIEIVENEPTTARAFQCNWETCGKVRYACQLWRMAR